MENVLNTRPFLSPFHVHKGHFWNKQCIFFSQKLRVLEQNGQRHKKDNSKAGLKANEKGPYQTLVN